MGTSDAQSLTKLKPDIMFRSGAGLDGSSQHLDPMSHYIMRANT